MAKNFLYGGRHFASALVALSASLLLMTGCNETAEVVKNGGESSKTDDVKYPNHGMPVDNNVRPDFGGDAPIVTPVGVGGWDTIELMVRTDPAEPENERFLDDWRFEIFSIDDQARPTSPTFYGETGPDGNALIGLPAHMFALPLQIAAYNDVLPLIRDRHHHHDGVATADGAVAAPAPAGDVATADRDDDEGHYGDCRQYEIFVPAYCYDKAVWLLGPFEDTLWRFYKDAARYRAESWNPSQVDCGTWLANMQLLILSDRVADELNDLSDTADKIFDPEVLVEALQENQHLLTPTRPPICMAERRHNGGGMERAEIIEQEDDEDFIIDENRNPWRHEVENRYNDDDEDDAIIIDLGTGIVSDICGNSYSEDEVLTVNGVTFVPGHDQAYILDDQDFMGTIHDQTDTVPGMDVSVFNTRLGNGYPLDSDVYEDACSLTSIIEFTNTNDDEKDVLAGTGVTFFNLFEGDEAEVYLTSDGDSVVDDNDYWAIFYTGDEDCEERVFAVELIGHREEDFRDVLHMTFFDETEDLFVGLRADYELNEEEVDGERAFLAYTVTAWDGSDRRGRREVREQVANCYLAADVWARQFFITQDFDIRDDECCVNDECEIKDVICPLEAAEFAVRSQCFSNSRSNQRWRTDDAGYWSMNTDHGVPGDVIVNAGWLAPNLDFEIYVQKFDEAVFKGPRTVRTTDDVGQLMVELPTLVEGDRVLIKSEDNCCDDYDLVIPCVPEFTGFAGAPGVPYTPVTLGPPVPGPVPVP